MHHLSRFGVSLEEDLLAAFDVSIGSEGYQNRSEAIRDLIRDHLIQKKVGQGDTEVIGVVTLVYDHRIHHLSDVLADMQHKASVAVNASQFPSGDTATESANVVFAGATICRRTGRARLGAEPLT